MAATNEDIEIIRTLIPDTDAIYGTAENEYLWTDEQLQHFYTAGSESILRAAGLAMVAVGNSEAMILKIIRTQDLQTNGAELQNQWRQSGKLLLDRADAADNVANAEFFQIIDFPGWGTYPPELTEPDVATVW